MYYRLKSLRNEMKTSIPTEIRRTRPMFDTVGPIFSKIIPDSKPERANCVEWDDLVG